jgi:hypothetical protein
MKIQQLLEGISPVVFHYTSTSNALNIIKNNRFQLTTSYGTDAEGWLAQKNKIFYLSTTRHRLGGYHLTRGIEGAMFNLDGTKLAQRYSGDPVDYWGHEFRKLEPTGAEAEDRIYHTKPTIPNALDYIKEVHVYIREQDLDNDNSIRRSRQLMIELKRQGIPHYFYTDHKDWMLQNKNKSVPFPDRRTPPKDPGFYRTSRPFSGYMELLKKSSREQLGRDGQRVLRYLDRQRDFESQLKNDVHNNKSRVEESGLDTLLALFKQLGLKTPADVFNYLHNKWMR